MTKQMLLLTSLLAFAGCAGLSKEQPVSTAQTASGGPPNQQPQSPNSLPLGSQVAAPFATGYSDTNVRVGPSGSQPMVTGVPPVAGTGTATAPATPRRVPNAY